MFIRLNKRLLEYVNVSGVDVNDGDVVFVYPNTIEGVDDNGNLVDISEHRFIIASVSDKKGNVVPTLFEISSKNKGNEVFNKKLNKYVPTRIESYKYNKLIKDGDIEDSSIIVHVKCDQPYYNVIDTIEKVISKCSDTFINQIIELYNKAKSNNKLKLKESVQLNESYTQDTVVDSIIDFYNEYEIELNVFENVDDDNLLGEIYLYKDNDWYEYLILECDWDSLFLFNGDSFDSIYSFVNNTYSIDKGKDVIDETLYEKILYMILDYCGI